MNSEAWKIKPWFEIYPQIKDPAFGPDNPCWMFVRQDGDNINAIEVPDLNNVKRR